MVLADQRKLIVGAAALLVIAAGTYLAFNMPKSVDARTARREVKSAIDPRATAIRQTPVDITIDDLVHREIPGTLAGREEPFETTIWRIKGTIETIELKKDGDYYMVVRDPKSGTQTVVEVPDPETCKGSPLYDGIAATRQQLEQKFHPTSEKQNVNEPATITGVGFYGFGSGKKKGSSGYSGPRLMPGNSVSF